jgi:hypothetical protein
MSDSNQDTVENKFTSEKLNDKQRRALVFLQNQADLDKKSLDIKASFVIKDVSGFFKYLRGAKQVADKFCIELGESGVKIEFVDRVQMLAVSATFKNGISVKTEEKTPFRRDIHLEEFLKFHRSKKGTCFYEILFTCNQTIIQYFNLDVSIYIIHRLLPDIFLPRPEVAKMTESDKIEEKISYVRFYSFLNENYKFSGGSAVGDQSDLMELREQFDKCLKKIEHDSDEIRKAEFLKQLKDPNNSKAAQYYVEYSANCLSKDDLEKLRLYKYIQSKKYPSTKINFEPMMKISDVMIMPLVTFKSYPYVGALESVSVKDGCLVIEETDTEYGLSYSSTQIKIPYEKFQADDSESPAIKNYSTLVAKFMDYIKRILLKSFNKSDLPVKIYLQEDSQIIIEVDSKSLNMLVALSNVEKNEEEPKEDISVEKRQREETNLSEKKKKSGDSVRESKSEEIETKED